jgi:putative restriction endonuclease
MTRNIWSRNELIAAFNLYCKIPFSKIHYSHPQVVELARIIGRTPSSVALKLVNFARLDPKLQSRNVAGMSHGSKAEKEIWAEFYGNGNWEDLAYQSEAVLARLKGESIEQSAGLDTATLPKDGKMRQRMIKVRVNQNFFRSAVLAAYNSRCCITGLPVAELLVASHIIPWAKDEKNRMNPANALCLNLLHDKAFDRGLITISTDYRLKLSKILLMQKKNAAVQSLFLPYENQPIRLPNRFLPDTAFLEYHNNVIFQKG